MDTTSREKLDECLERLKAIEAKLDAPATDTLEPSPEYTVSELFGLPEQTGFHETTRFEPFHGEKLITFFVSNDTAYVEFRWNGSPIETAFNLRHVTFSILDANGNQLGDAIGAGVGVRGPASNDITRTVGEGKWKKVKGSYRDRTPEVAPGLYTLKIETRKLMPVPLRLIID